jgi:D-aspartate ligase
MDYRTNNPAFVFGMFETGLAVGRSLGRRGVCVFGFDHKKDIGFYSRYINSDLTPHPLKNPEDFKEYLLKKSQKFDSKPVVYITSDDYLEFFVTNQNEFKKYLHINIVGENILDLTFSKNKFYTKFIGTGIPIPGLYDYDKDAGSQINFPVLIKGDNVNRWREKVNSSNKVIIAKDINELGMICSNLRSQNIDFVMQEIIPGGDNCFYKYCAYRTMEGNIINEFMLRKLRQNPVRFGVGSLVVSCINDELRQIGREVFQILDYKGIGSVEFKIDERDGKFKLIELNARYWQQNSLSDVSGINFPFIEYLYLTEQDYSAFHNDYETGIKWVNIYMDFASFLVYRKEKQLTLFDWIDQIKGKKVFSDLAGDDLMPSFYETVITNKFRKVPKYLRKILLGD